jgi:hypothetical protein
MSTRIGADVVRLLARLGVAGQGYHELARARRAAAAAAAWPLLAATDRELMAQRGTEPAPVEAPAETRRLAAAVVPARPAPAAADGGFVLLALPAPLSLERR